MLAALTFSYFLYQNDDNQKEKRTIKKDVMESYYGMSRTLEGNPARTVVLSKQDGEYVVGKKGKDLQPGFYDVRVLNSDKANFAGWNLNEKDKLHAIHFSNNNKFGIFEGQVELTPSTFQKLEKVDDYYTISHSGYYVVGAEIPVGKYEFILDGNTVPLNTFIDVEFQGKETRQSIQWDNKKNARANSINLKKDAIIYVDKKDTKDNQRDEIVLKVKKVNKDTYYN